MAFVRQRLLWRVRRKLIISYIFVGFVPVILIIAFFLLGITEAMNAGDDCFGESRLGELIQSHADLPPDQLRERVLREIASFVGDAPQHDDMTMILLKIEDIGAAAVSRTIDADFAVAAGFVSAQGGARPAPARVG